ncbi:MAG: DUF5915 domain-containing protein [Rickettsiales bacterium]|jgi:isoleucyl-tRNA synthetase|nr:DUF5915 domain-containing protein [Rickettsiales bacterium]
MHIGDSVHLQNYPELENFAEDDALVGTMDLVRAICGCALTIRDRNNLRIRLPLGRITIIAENTAGLEEFSSVLADEINVKAVEFLNNVGDFSESRVVLNFQHLGTRVGSKMPDLVRAVEANDWKMDRDGHLKIGGFELAGDEFSIQLRPKRDDVFPVAGYNTLVKLDLNISEELRCEGAARDLVRLVQQLRKDSNLDIAARIELFVRTGYPLLISSLEKHRCYIEEQTLARSLARVEDSYFDCLFSTSGEIDRNPVKIGFNVVD